MGRRVLRDNRFRSAPKRVRFGLRRVRFGLERVGSGSERVRSLVRCLLAYLGRGIKDVQPEALCAGVLRKDVKSEAVNCVL